MAEDAQGWQKAPKDDASEDRSPGLPAQVLLLPTFVSPPIHSPINLPPHNAFEAY